MSCTINDNRACVTRILHKHVFVMLVTPVGGIGLLSADIFCFIMKMDLSLQEHLKPTMSVFLVVWAV